MAKRRYQGREKTSILQANTKAGLDTLIRSSRSFADEHGMERFKVLESGKDPDGGYRAIVTAHNWGPTEWVKRKFAGIGRGKSTITPEPPPEPTEEETAYRRWTTEEEEKAEERARVRAGERERAVTAVREGAEQTERLRFAKLTPREQRAEFEAERLEGRVQARELGEAEIARVEQVKTLREARPTKLMRLARGAREAVTAIREREAEVETEYGPSGEVISRRVTRKPRGFRPTRRGRGMEGMGFAGRAIGGSGMGLAGRALMPGTGFGSKLSPIGGLDKLRQLQMPGGNGGRRLGVVPGSGGPGMGFGAPGIETIPVVEKRLGLTENQNLVYQEVLDGTRTEEDIAENTELTKSAVTKALKFLEKKGLIDFGG